MSDTPRTPLHIVSDTPAERSVAIDAFAHWLPQLPEMTPEELKALYYDMIDAGPRELILAIETEFKRRRIDPISIQSLA